MIKFNVKHTTNTNLMTETLTTKCVKLDTAINRFCRFLDDYDSCFKESVLIAFMTIRPVGYVDGVLSYQSVSETDDYYVTVSGLGSVWSVTIEFKHNENTEHYRSVSHPFLTDNKESDSKTDNKESDSKTDNKESDSKTDNKESDSKTDNKESDNKGYMKCEYFFSLDPKLPPKCKHCIYSERDFCPADLEHYKGICDE